MTSAEKTLIPRLPTALFILWAMLAVLLPIGLVGFGVVSMSLALVLGFALSVAVLAVSRIKGSIPVIDCWRMLLIGLTVTVTAFPLAITMRGLLIFTLADDSKARGVDLLESYAGQIQGPLFWALLLCASVPACGIIFHMAKSQVASAALAASGLGASTHADALDNLGDGS